MDNPGEILRLCRLCLVKDQVNIPIFEEQGDIRQIFLKISSCLPVKVSLEDKLPKRICDGCSNKLDLLYEFWNTSANAEKTLLSWLGQAGVKDADETISAVAQQIAKPAETQVKQEALDEGHASNQVHDSFGVQSFDEEAKDESEAPPPKRARRTAAVKAQINLTPESDEDDDMDSAEAMTKVEDESDESDGEDKDPSYGEIPGTSADDQAGPSGVGKDGVEAPNEQDSESSETIPSLIKKMKNRELIKSMSVGENVEYNKTKIICQCGKIINKYRFKTHLLTHIKHKCSMCEQTFSSEELLKKHTADDHAVVDYVCGDCGLIFRKIKDIALHRFSHTGIYGCPACHVYIGADKNLFIEHMNQEHPSEDIDEPEAYQCNECHLVYNTKLKLALHMFKHTGKFACPHCPFVSQDKTSSSLLNHITVHHEKAFKVHCRVCGRGFLKEAALKLHEEIHAGEPKYECEICGKKFKVSRYLKNHRTLNHQNELNGTEETIPCEFCGRSFKWMVSLKRHLNIIHGVGESKRAECPVCKKVIANEYNLKIHMTVHTGEKQFCCEQCGKAFRLKKYFDMHMQKCVVTKDEEIEKFEVDEEIEENY